MGRLPPLILAAILVISILGMSTIVLGQTGDDTPVSNDSDVAPGEHLGGAIGVQNAEIDGDLQERRFGTEIAAVATDDEAADIVGEQLDSIDAHITNLTNEQEHVKSAYESEEISKGQYNARMATIATERATVDRLTNQSHAVADGLPADVLSAHNISVERIEELRDRAADLTGPEVAEIARDIAGPGVGEGLPHASEDDSDDRGPPVDHGPSDVDDDEDDTTNE